MSGCHKPYMKICDEPFESISLTDLINQVNELENSYRGLFHEYDYLDERIKRLELRLKELERFQNITIKGKPHKCPVCDGNRVALQPDSNGGAASLCRVCDAKGIVWG